MPSHQIRVQQNNCEHRWMYYLDQLGILNTKTYKECINCHKRIEISVDSQRS